MIEARLSAPSYSRAASHINIKKRAGWYILKSASNELKRKIRYETSCIDGKTVAITTGAFAAMTMLTAISSVKSAVYKKFTPPKLSLSPFWCIFIFVLMAALFGAALGVLISLPARNGKNKSVAVASGICAFVLSCAWIVLVYSAASFLIAALVAGVIFALSAVSYSVAAKMNKLASWAVLGYGVWVIYLFYFSLALAFLS